MILQMGLILGENIVFDDINLIIGLMLKLFFLLGFGLYAIFAFIATRQIAIMKKTLITTFSPLVSLLGYIHLSLALVVLAIVFFI